MHRRVPHSGIAVRAALLLGGAALAAPAHATGASGCNPAAVQRLVAPEVTIEAASAVVARPGVPAHCAIKGHIAHGTRIGFAAALPAEWNGKFLFYGIGGFAGVLNPLDQPPSSQGLAKGYATATTDTGHQSSGVEDATWVRDNPAAILNHFESGVDVAARATKALVTAWYGRAPARAYFEGCSAGGRQGMVEAERFPTTFDGIIAAAPAWNYGALLSTFVLNGQRILQSPAGWIPPETFAAIDQEVLRQCDSLDGVTDGILMDPRQCRPDLHKLSCKPGASGKQCLTSPQRTTLEALLRPPHRAAGYYGFHLTGTDRSGPFFGWPDWMFGTTPTALDAAGKLHFGSRVLQGADRGRGPLQFLLGEQFFRFMVMNDPAYDARGFDFTRDMAVLRRKLGGFLDAGDTDLGPFVRSGGKLLIWHGWSDGAIPPEMAIDLHSRIRRDTGEAPGQPPVDQSVRLFMVPGVQHCSWGTGLTEFDALAALEAWVERGRAPDRIHAAQLVDGKPKRSRPLCAYPKVARYRGTGDSDDAANFDCR